MAKGFKSGGRTKGTPNKRTTILGEALNELSFDVPELLVILYPELDAKDKLACLLEVMSYIYPKKKALETEERPPLDVFFSVHGNSAPKDLTEQIDRLREQRKLSSGEDVD